MRREPVKKKVVFRLPPPFPLLCFKTKGSPRAFSLIAIGYPFPKAVRLAFSALNTSNEGRDIQKILFFSVRSDADGHYFWYIFGVLVLFGGIDPVFNFYTQHGLLNYYIKQIRILNPGISRVRFPSDGPVGSCPPERVKRSRERKRYGVSALFGAVYST